MIDQEHRTRYLISAITDRLVQQVMDEMHLPIVEAMAAVYNSRVFSLLQEPETGLYTQSPDYVYNDLYNELTTASI